MAQQQSVGILVFDEVEVLDFCGPFEVFASATTASDEPSGEQRLFRPLIVAEQNRLIHCRGGLLVQPHHSFADAPAFDVIVIPGGFGTRREIDNPRVLAWIAEQNERAELVTSVCTGAFLLAQIGLLNGKRATTHWQSVDWMRERFPAVQMLDTERVVDEGRIVTSAGVSAGIDMALHVVARLHGEEIANATARDMEYEWARPGRAG